MTGFFLEILIRENFKRPPDILRKLPVEAIRALNLGVNNVGEDGGAHLLEVGVGGRQRAAELIQGVAHVQHQVVTLKGQPYQFTH